MNLKPTYERPVIHDRWEAVYRSNPLQVAIPAPGSTGGLVPLSASSTILYNLCGVNSTDCAIGVGQPSSNRLLLLRRRPLCWAPRRGRPHWSGWRAAIPSSTFSTGTAR